LAASNAEPAAGQVLAAYPLLPSASSTSRQRAFTSAITSIKWQRVSRSRGERTSTATHCAREIATSSRFRLVEALPWLLLKYWNVDREWLVREAKLRNLQNRLGFVVHLVRNLAERTHDEPRSLALNALETELDRSRLVHEDTLCKASLREPERRWLEANRSDEAKHWNLVTDWTAKHLRYVS
jgi:hypothetical protein